MTYSARDYQRMYGRHLGPLAQAVTLKVNNGTGWDDYPGVMAHVTGFREQDLVEGGPIQVGDLKVIIPADQLPGGANMEKLDRSDRIRIGGRDYAVVRWDDQSRRMGDTLIAIEALVRG